MSAISARCGAYVNAGQVIGAVGSTGDSSGPHLHFEIRYNDVPTDPTGTMAF
jgi:murein DD-endopeptidase MepM/ murein hydrolase activator NlpD